MAAIDLSVNATLPSDSTVTEAGSTSSAFRADGGSQLDMQPNPYDVVGIPILAGFTLVR